MSSSYPLNSEVVCAERVARWRPLVNWVLVIPLYLWLAVLGYGAALVSLVGWFAILFTGRLPERLGDYLVAALRYQWRVVAFLFGWTTSCGITSTARNTTVTRRRAAGRALYRTAG